MLELSQTCPSCRSSKYSNPQLKLMVNTCGHTLCESCVEVLFVRGSGLCVQCKTPIRKVNFRYQLFEDPSVQKEVELRKRILSDDYYSVYNLLNDVEVEETKRYVELYKKENKDVIKKNRLRPSASMQFYDTELERESLLREQHEKEDEEKRAELFSRLTGPAQQGHPDSTGNLNNSSVPSADTATSTFPSTIIPGTATPASSLKRPINLAPPTSRFPQLTPASQLFAPASAMPNRGLMEHTFIPPPPSAVSGLSAIPSSMMPTMGGRSWAMPRSGPIAQPGQPIGLNRQADTVLIPSRTQSTRSGNRATNNAPTAFVYEPYQPDLCGPSPPIGSEHPRWPEIFLIYKHYILDQIKPKLEEEAEDSHQSSLVPIKPEQGDVAMDTSSGVEQMDVCTKKEDNGGDGVSTPERISSASLLPAGACGIGPTVFLERCLQESRCGLFL